MAMGQSLKYFYKLYSGQACWYRYERKEIQSKL